MNKNAFLFVIMYLIGGCSMRPNVATYQDALSSWLGQSEENLYSEWGYPNTTYSVDPATFIVTYIQNYKDPIDGDTTPYSNQMTYSAMRVPSYGLPTPQGVYYCKTSFVIRDGVVVDYNLSGDDCVR